MVSMDVGIFIILLCVYFQWYIVDYIFLASEFWGYFVVSAVTWFINLFISGIQMFLPISQHFLPSLLPSFLDFMFWKILFSFAWNLCIQYSNSRIAKLSCNAQLGVYGFDNYHSEWNKTGTSVLYWFISLMVKIWNIWKMYLFVIYSSFWGDLSVYFAISLINFLLFLLCCLFFYMYVCTHPLFTCSSLFMHICVQAHGKQKINSSIIFLGTIHLVLLF